MSQTPQDELIKKYLEKGIMIENSDKKMINEKTIKRNLKGLVEIMGLDPSEFFKSNWKTVHITIDGEHNFELEPLDALKGNLYQTIQLNLAKLNLVKVVQGGKEAVEWCQGLNSEEKTVRIDSEEKTGSVKTSGQLDINKTNISFDWPEPKALLQLFLAEKELEICA